MKTLKTILFVVLFAATAFSQGNTTKFRTASTLPSICSPGTGGIQAADMLVLNTGGASTLYMCQSPNAWVSLGSIPNALPAPNDPEGYMTWQPGTLYPAVLAGTCTFSASTTCSISYGTTFSGVPVVNLTPVNPGAVTFTLTATSTTGFTITASSSNSLAVNYTATTPSGTNCTQLNFQLIGARQNLDFVVPLFNQSLPSNILPTAWISASDQATIRLCNQGTSAVSFSTNLTWGAKILR